LIVSVSSVFHGDRSLVGAIRPPNGSSTAIRVQAQGRADYVPASSFIEVEKLGNHASLVVIWGKLQSSLVKTLGNSTRLLFRSKVDHRRFPNGQR
jgi:hypothetical protein